jgi:hypothetical protein
VLVITALAMVVLLGLMALGLDLGLVLLRKQELANAADAAALAGVQELPASAENARLRAIQYGVGNGMITDQMSVSVSSDLAEVGVVVSETVDLFFAPVLGIRQATVSARATARTGTVSGVMGVVPLSVEQDDFVFGEKYYLKYGSPDLELDGTTEPEEPISGVRQGNFGALALGGTGASNYLDKFMHGYRKMMRVGDIVETETGNMAGPTENGVKWRTEGSAALTCTIDNVTRACPQLVIVPVVDKLTKGGRGPVTVVGFAAFFLEGTDRKQSRSYVVGRFLRRVVDGEIGHAGDFGLQAYRLVE